MVPPSAPPRRQQRRHDTKTPTTALVLASLGTAALAQNVDIPGIDDEPGRTGLSRIGNDLSDTIDDIDGDYS
jgi:hypothetical protein